MEIWTIGEAARRAGVRPSAIRYYESVGLIPRPARRNGRRVYDRSILSWLGLVRLARQAGFSISETRTLVHGFARKAPPSKRWRSLASRKLEEVQEQIRRAEAMQRVLEQLMTCECPSLQDCGAAIADA